MFSSRRACGQWGQPLVAVAALLDLRRGCPKTCGQRHQNLADRQWRSRRCPVHWGQPLSAAPTCLQAAPGCPRGTSGPALSIGHLADPDVEPRLAQEFFTIGVSFTLTRSAVPMGTTLMHCGCCIGMHSQGWSAPPRGGFLRSTYRRWRPSRKGHCLRGRSSPQRTDPRSCGHRWGSKCCGDS